MNEEDRAESAASAFEKVENWRNATGYFPPGTDFRSPNAIYNDMFKADLGFDPDDQGALAANQPRVDAWFLNLTSRSFSPRNVDNFKDMLHDISVSNVLEAGGLSDTEDNRKIAMNALLKWGWEDWTGEKLTVEGYMANDEWEHQKNDWIAARNKAEEQGLAPPPCPRSPFKKLNERLEKELANEGYKLAPPDPPAASEEAAPIKTVCTDKVIPHIEYTFPAQEPIRPERDIIDKNYLRLAGIARSEAEPCPIESTPQTQLASALPPAPLKGPSGR